MHATDLFDIRDKHLYQCEGKIPGWGAVGHAVEAFETQSVPLLPYHPSTWCGSPNYGELASLGNVLHQSALLLVSLFSRRRLLIGPWHYQFISIRPSPQFALEDSCASGRMKLCKCFGRKRTDKKTEDIDALLKKDAKATRNESKLLLLGAGESGKSTILRQMKLIHQGGYNVQELRAYRPIIYGNVIESMQQILRAADKFDFQLEDPNNAEYKQLILSLGEQTGPSILPEPVIEALTKLWSDLGVRRSLRKARRKTYIIDSAKYFLENLDRIVQPTYTPTNEDILRSRVKTTGITETAFSTTRGNFRLFDVGGQRSERKKWIHCFDNVRAIIFIVAISEYDQRLLEDDTMNRMQEALTLFDFICNSRWFINTSIILFMNKIDIFAEKIEEVPLENFFSDYVGGPDYDAARKYIEDRFRAISTNDQRNLYVKYTCATDTDQIKFVMESVEDIIQNESLGLSGI